MPRIKNKNDFLFRRRKLRKRQTKQEKILWDFLRNRILKVKFRRQYGIGGYILDFYCPEIKLVIELDGWQHLEKDHREYDKERTNFLKVFGCTVFRFSNSDIDNNLENVLQDIDKFIKAKRR